MSMHNDLRDWEAEALEDAEDQEPDHDPPGYWDGADGLTPAQRNPSMCGRRP